MPTSRKRIIVKKTGGSDSRRKPTAGADEHSMLTPLRRYHGRTAAQIAIRWFYFIGIGIFHFT